MRKQQPVEHKAGGNGWSQDERKRKKTNLLLSKERDGDRNQVRWSEDAGTETRKRGKDKRGIDPFRQLGRKLKPTVPF